MKINIFPTGTASVQVLDNIDMGVNVGPVWPLIVERGQFTMAV
jgi:hypothetical protein